MATPEEQAAANRAAEQEAANKTARDGLAAAQAEQARKTADEAKRKQGK